MKEMKKKKAKKSYKLWHMIVAFFVGATVCAGVILLPSYGGQGFLSKKQLQDVKINPVDYPSPSDVYELQDPFDVFTQAYSTQYGEFPYRLQQLVPKEK